ncbi:MAG: GDSL-type esterase/lipase family protein [Candidatus Omnitrophica bacterium]|nr:GDSL-type esterase/lipase family protein [Candidatus Omnitrophota bacterium]MDD5592148.1 GDSL-type esterase/lipase family protein [Candidatus Omnitrophota bacterium]
MLRNKILVIGLLGYCIIALCACAKKEIKNIDSQGVNIICFGDSITFGYGAQSGEDYPTAMAKLTVIPVLNMGIDGDTSVEALKRLNSDVLTRQPLVAIIEFGGNDFLRKIPQETTIVNVREMVEKIQAVGAMVAVVDISTGPFLAEYRKGFSKICKEKGAIFIPGALSGIITNPRLKSDFIHPNCDGYKLIAQRIYKAVRPYLSQNSLLRQAQK